MNDPHFLTLQCFNWVSRPSVLLVSHKDGKTIDKYSSNISCFLCKCGMSNRGSRGGWPKAEQRRSFPYSRMKKTNSWYKMRMVNV